MTVCKPTPLVKTISVWAPVANTAIYGKFAYSYYYAIMRGVITWASMWLTGTTGKLNLFPKA